MRLSMFLFCLFDMINIEHKYLGIYLYRVDDSYSASIIPSFIIGKMYYSSLEFAFGYKKKTTNFYWVYVVVYMEKGTTGCHWVIRFY